MCDDAAKATLELQEALCAQQVGSAGRGRGNDV